MTPTLSATTAIASVTLRVTVDLAAAPALEATSAGEEIRAATLRATTVVGMTETTVGALPSVAAGALVVAIATSVAMTAAAATNTAVIIDASRATRGVKTGARSVGKSAVVLTRIAAVSALQKTVIAALLAHREEDPAHATQVSNNLHLVSP